MTHMGHVKELFGNVPFTLLPARVLDVTVVTKELSEGLGTPFTIGNHKAMS